jgi:hypothetical protein
MEREKESGCGCGGSARSAFSAYKKWIQLTLIWILFFFRDEEILPDQ